jgi:hypothetical protein
MAAGFLLRSGVVGRDAKYYRRRMAFLTRAIDRLDERNPDSSGRRDGSSDPWATSLRARSASGGSCSSRTGDPTDGSAGRRGDRWPSSPLLLASSSVVAEAPAATRSGFRGVELPAPPGTSTCSINQWVLSREGLRGSEPIRMKNRVRELRGTGVVQGDLPSASVSRGRRSVRSRRGSTTRAFRCVRHCPPVRAAD